MAASLPRLTADISPARTLRTAQAVTAGLRPSAPRSGPSRTSPAARLGKPDGTRNAWRLRASAAKLDLWKFPRIGEISRALGFKSPSDTSQSSPDLPIFRGAGIRTASPPAGFRRSGSWGFKSALDRRTVTALRTRHSHGSSSPAAERDYVWVSGCSPLEGTLVFAAPYQLREWA